MTETTASKPGSAYPADAYAAAGVDIDAGNAFVGQIGDMIARTRNAGFGGAVGGFGGVFDLKATGLKDPLLVGATDGVGTKLLLALETDQLEPLGQDLVAMCVNDLVVQGAMPLFFLDYLATGKLEPERMARLVSGVAKACSACDCALIGGETAEMPGLYAEKHFDMAGFALGAVERGDLLPKSNVAEGDHVIGLASSGLHSNGFSLVRKILNDNKVAISDPSPFDRSRPLKDYLLEPTKLYVQTPLALHKKGLIKAFAHITGGGLLENLPRVLPDGLMIEIDLASWNLPPTQAWLAEIGGIDRQSLYRTFNTGIGFCIVASPKASDVILNYLANAGEAAHQIGQVAAARPGEERVVLRNAVI